MARNTKDRILKTALSLFNQFGEPNVTTNAIADGLEMSPGNLHYHFPSKTDVVSSLFEQYEKKMVSLLATPPDRAADLEDIWLLFHLSFEVMGEYQFIYRDLTNLCLRHRGIHQKFLALLALAKQTATILVEDLRDSGLMEASDEEAASLIDSVLLISNFWLANDRIVSKDGKPQPHRAVGLVMGVISPLLVPQARELASHLAAGYR